MIGHYHYSMGNSLISTIQLLCVADGYFIQDFKLCLGIFGKYFQMYVSDSRLLSLDCLGLESMIVAQAP